MTVLRLISDNYFIFSTDRKTIAVKKFQGNLVNYTVSRGRSDNVGVVGPGKLYNELEVFGVVIRGQTLQQLATDLANCRCLVNREGYCYFNNTGDALRGIPVVIGEQYLRLNDLFFWSKYGVTPTITTVWNRRDPYNNVTLVNYQQLRDKLSLETSLKLKDEELTECKSKVTELEREASKHKKDLEEKDKIIKEKNKEIQQLKAELEGKKEELSTSKDSLKQKEKLLGEKNEELKTCKTELEEKKELSKTRRKKSF